MASKLDLVRNAITDMRAMTEEEYVASDYWGKIVAAGGASFTECIYTLTDGDTSMPSKDNAIAYMKTVLAICLCNIWASETTLLQKLF